ncbi:MAG: histidinol-phosphate aminotransferase family protein [Bacteroidia bacterium]|nr:histidinol-phosphate aminotransferase family protein [Bacteroidia bacterium]
MLSKSSRRQWLKSSLLLAAGAAAAPLSSLAAPTRRYRAIRTIEEDLVIPPMMPELRARLLANENPFGPSQSAKDAVMATIARGNRYPMDEGENLLSMVAAKEQVPQGQILLGPGSTQLLDMAALGIVGNGVVLTADPSYLSLIETVEENGGSSKRIRLTADHAHDLEAMEAAIDDSISMVYICNPNNPTGTITESNALRAFCSRVSERVPVFVDEAYLDFMPNAMSHSMVDLVREGKNVIVSRTFSKVYGLAGMRIGYLVAQEATIQPLSLMNHVQWDISAVSIAAAQATMQDEAFLADCIKKNQESKDFLYAMLKEDGYDFLPSSTNFVLFPIRMRTQPFREAMFAQGVGIRTFDLHRQPYCRVSMGTMEEMEIFRDAFRKVVG